MDFVGRKMLQILVVVPTRELVVQTTMLAYKLTGGSISRGCRIEGTCSTIRAARVDRERRVRAKARVRSRSGVIDGRDCDWDARGVGGVEEARYCRGGFGVAYYLRRSGSLLNHKEAMRELLKPSRRAVMETRRICLVGVSIANDSFLKDVQEVVPFYEPTIIQTQAIDYKDKGWRRGKKREGRGGGVGRTRKVGRREEKKKEDRPHRRSRDKE